jgi:DNA-binding CsgD family transcriptional regulator/catechol 2,3-dioxygenase-like lactoylglutathione lyase family enzyme
MNVRKKTTARRGRPPHDDVLTPTEWRIVHAVQHGLTNREIATRRGVSVDAVKFHMDNIRAKLGIDRKRSLRTWFRSPQGSALAIQGQLTQSEQSMSTLSLGPIGQISRSVRNIRDTEDWYKNVLGLPHLYTFGKLAFFDCSGTRLFLSENEQAGPESILYLKVPDIGAAYAALQSRGVTFTSAPHMIHEHADGTEEWMAFFNDLEGRPLAIMSHAREP